MQSASYYREQAAKALQLSGMAHQEELRELLWRLAEDYADIAEDLENGAIEIRHVDLLPQRRRQR